MISHLFIKTCANSRNFRWFHLARVLVAQLVGEGFHPHQLRMHSYHPRRLFRYVKLSPKATAECDARKDAQSERHGLFLWIPCFAILAEISTLCSFPPEVWRCPGSNSKLWDANGVAFWLCRFVNCRGSTGSPEKVLAALEGQAPSGKDMKGHNCTGMYKTVSHQIVYLIFFKHDEYSTHYIYNMSWWYIMWEFDNYNRIMLIHSCIPVLRTWWMYRAI